MVKILYLSTLLIAAAMNLAVAVSAGPVEARQAEPSEAPVANPGDAPAPGRSSGDLAGLLPDVGAVLNGYLGVGTVLNAVHQLRLGKCEPFASNTAEWSFKKDANTQSKPCSFPCKAG